MHKTVCWTEYKITRWGSLVFFFYLYVLILQLTRSQWQWQNCKTKKEEKNMNHHIIICWFSPLFLEALLLFLTVGLVSVTRDWMCQRCRWIHSILPPPPASKGRVRRCPWCWNTGSHISYCSSLFLSFSHQNHLIRYNFPVIPPPSPAPYLPQLDRIASTSSPLPIMSFLETRRTELSRNRQEKISEASIRRFFCFLF